MGTGLIIKSQILSVWMPKNTLALAGTQMRQEGQSIFLPMPEKETKSGINLNRGESGTSGRPKGKNNGQNGKDSLSHARIAVKNLWLLFVNKVSISFAMLTAKPLIIESIRHFPATETEDVWCLTVPGIEHFSLENGAIVHNCASAARYAALAASRIKGDISSKPPATELPTYYQSGAWMG
jgi:hypothetical protein